jgi:diguanylate cyclase (GGDEF)-like protein
MPQTNGVCIVWASFIALSGLYYSQWFKKAVLISSCIACVVALLFVKEYPFSILSACVIFLSMVPIPYYFHIKSKKLKKEFFLKNRMLKIKHKANLLKLKKSFNERQKYEDNIEIMMQIYIIGKEISKCVSKGECAETILKTLKEKTGIIGCSFFEKTKVDWKMLASSEILHNENLIPYIQSLEFSNNDKKFGVMYSRKFSNRNFEMVYWPLKIADELLGCIIIVTDTEDANRYVEEGSIFGPQISLGLKRINLFNQIDEKSRKDGLTGLYLKRYFLQRLDLEMQRGQRYNDGFYILMLDLDYFKDVNDKYGHLVGDKVLAVVAKSISDDVRLCDLVSRYGGEEFIILMPMIDKNEVKNAAEKVRKSIKDIIFEANNDKFNITVSIGVSCNSKNISNPAHIINAADKALYKAKSIGRNEVVLYDEID